MTARIWPILFLPIVVVLVAGGASGAGSPETGILFAYWRELPGTTIADLTSSAAYPKFPDEQIHLDRFEIPENQQPNFGTVVRGYLHPPQDGDYTFYIAGNSQCELWLSDSDNATNAKLIASVPEWSLPRDWSADPAQQSKPIHLTSNSRYYVEARHKNGGGDNHLSVSWKLPNGTIQTPIAGQHLSPATPVPIPETKVRFSDLPAQPGVHRITATLDYPARSITVPLLLTLPPQYAANGSYPLLVFLPDMDEAADAEGIRLQGPDQFAHPGASPFVAITPQCPPGHSYEQRSTIKALAAATMQLARHYPVDLARVCLTGWNTGATASWQFAVENPGFYRSLAPVCGRQSADHDLAPVLNGTRVLIYTDIANGVATEGANRMHDLLFGLQPPCKVVYLGETELGHKGSAAAHCFSRPDFYASLFATPEPPARATASPEPSRGLLAGIIVASAAAVVLAWRLLFHRCQSR